MPDHNNWEPGTACPCRIPAAEAVIDSLVARHILSMSPWPSDLTCLSLYGSWCPLLPTTNWPLSSPVLATQSLSCLLHRRTVTRHWSLAKGFRAPCHCSVLEGSTTTDPPSTAGERGREQEAERLGGSVVGIGNCWRGRETSASGRYRRIRFAVIWG